jgi:hypothetical protein
MRTARMFMTNLARRRLGRARCVCASGRRVMGAETRQGSSAKRVPPAQTEHQGAGEGRPARRLRCLTRRIAWYANSVIR